MGGAKSTLTDIGAIILEVVFIMAQQVVCIPHSKKVVNSKPVLVKAFLCGLTKFSPCMHEFSECSCFVPPTKKHLMSIRDSKLSLGMSVNLNGCLSLYVVL